MRKVLITGSNGFVGTQFAEKLHKSDWEITFVDITDPYHAEDARDFFKFNDTKYNLVIHLAAVVGGRATIEKEPLKVAVDLAIDSDAFRWALRTKPDHFVYYSSSAAYPTWMQNGHKVRLDEDDISLSTIETPDLTYGWAKLTGEMLAEYAQQEGLRTHVFRPFSGYGETQSLDYPFPSFIDRAKRKADPFDIWGDGTQVRDWIHIDDIVNATLKAIDQDVQGPVNLCTGIPTSFNDLAHKITTMAGYNPQFNHILDAPKGVHYRVGHPTKLHTFYTPKISLEEGIKRSLK